MTDDQARVRAEKAIKTEQRARESAEVWRKHHAETLATQAKTARLRALRLAKEAMERTASSPAKVVEPAKPAAARNRN